MSSESANSLTAKHRVAPFVPPACLLLLLLLLCLLHRLLALLLMLITITLLVQLLSGRHQCPEALEGSKVANDITILEHLNPLECKTTLPSNSPSYPADWCLLSFMRPLILNILNQAWLRPLPSQMSTLQPSATPIRESMNLCGSGRTVGFAASHLALVVATTPAKVRSDQLLYSLLLFEKVGFCSSYPSAFMAPAFLYQCCICGNVAEMSRRITRGASLSQNTAFFAA